MSAPPTIEVIEDRIARLYWMADGDEVAAGEGWYRVAHEEARSIGRNAGYRGEQALHVGAGVLAALSPTVSWPLNVQGAHLLAADIEAVPAGYYSNHEKARRIIRKGTVWDVLSGPKVVPFARCIIDPDTYNVDDVVVDTWMLRATGTWPFRGRKATIPNVQRAIANKAHVYEQPYATIQAITWLVIRRIWESGLDPYWEVINDELR